MTRSDIASAEMTAGMLRLLLAHVVFGGSLFLLDAIAITTNFDFLRAIVGYSASFISLSQLLYAIPIIVCFKRKRRFNAVKGVVIGAAFTVLLNGGCFAFAFWYFTHM